MASIVERLQALPVSERAVVLESMVVAEFKETLLMSADEELPLAESYFELGLTSLGLTDVKQRLESLIGKGISSTVLFNSPTVEQLLDHLTAEVMPELFESRPEAAVSAAPAEQDALWDDVMRSLYQT
ncbi:acyl carrier protein [Sphaerisporangium sp. TRM90804]|uniref:acyl carrier protein n=1 Tax=Sphaerisporangium sp. TRM90804 TaxID=3031113 RepID=UPI00244D328B|nr:acyl carrier protein [Sphaerisporangium sp. TRM90804]MDH2428354.1 acyl carrier protein [Sphaerisporangium sp. TRM90804]